MRVKVDYKLILTVAFVLFFITELFFPYTWISQIMLFLFGGLGVLTVPRIYKNSFLLSYILFTVWSFAIIFFGFAIDKSVATDMTVTLCFNCMFLFAFTQYCGVINDPIAVFKTYKNICIFASCVFLVFGLPSVISGERLSILGINSNAISSFAAYSLIILIYELYEKKRCDYQDVFVFIVFSLVILLSASRKGVLIPLIGWYVLLCLRKPKKFIKNSLIIAALVIVFVFLVLTIEPLYNVVGYRIEPLLFLLQGAEVEEDSLMTRSHFIQYAWENSQDSLFFGHGLDCFRTLPKAYGTYSHSNYLELLFSTGWIGIAIYYSTAFLTLFKIPAVIKSNKTVAALPLAVLIPFLVCDYMNVTYYTRRLLIIPAIAIMFIGRYKNESTN